MPGCPDYVEQGHHFWGPTYLTGSWDYFRTRMDDILKQEGPTLKLISPGSLALIPSGEVASLYDSMPDIITAIEGLTADLTSEQVRFILAVGQLVDELFVKE